MPRGKFSSFGVAVLTWNFGLEKENWKILLSSIRLTMWYLTGINLGNQELILQGSWCMKKFLGNKERRFLGSRMVTLILDFFTSMPLLIRLEIVLGDSRMSLGVG